MRAFAAKPIPLYQPVKHWIKRSGANFVSVPPQFLDNPLTMNRLFAGVMQDMYFPKAQQYFSFGFVHITVFDVEKRY